MKPFSIVKTLFSNLLGWIETSNQHRALRELTDHQLSCIVINHKEIMAKACLGDNSQKGRFRSVSSDTPCQDTAKLF